MTAGASRECLAVTKECDAPPTFSLRHGIRFSRFHNRNFSLLQGHVRARTILHHFQILL